MAQAYVDHRANLLEESESRSTVGGLADPLDTKAIPVATRKAGRATKKLVRCRFCKGKKMTSSRLARHTLDTHEKAVRLLDNPVGAAAMFDIGYSMGGQKGAYLQHRAFYNLLQYNGVVKELPAWTKLKALKWNTDVQAVAIGEPLIDNSVFVVKEDDVNAEVEDSPEFERIPTPNAGGESFLEETDRVLLESGPPCNNSGVLDDFHGERHFEQEEFYPSDLENHCDEFTN